MRALAITCALAATAHADGDHLTGSWAGARDGLADAGVVFDVTYAAEVFGDAQHDAPGHEELLGHLDAAVTLDSERLHLWKGGKLYALVQNNEGHGINRDVGSATDISNLEAAPYTQLGELFLEQALGDDVSVRIGKQDANRDFGTPRFGGNFINNNFGMFPTSPLPSYPTNGLGASLGVTHGWLAVRAAVYEGSPEVGGLGLATAFKPHAGYMLAGLLAATTPFGARDTGTQSIGVWRQHGDLPAVDGSARTFEHDAGFYVQLDERFYRHPDTKDESGLTVILRFSWAQADRTDISRYLGGSIAYHGLGSRHDDTIGLGVGYFTVAQPVDGSEEFVEAFYKWRLTAYASLQPDVQVYRHPSGDRRDAVLVGTRLKVKL